MFTAPPRASVRSGLRSHSNPVNYQTRPPGNRVIGRCRGIRAARSEALRWKRLRRGHGELAVTVARASAISRGSRSTRRTVTSAVTSSRSTAHGSMAGDLRVSREDLAVTVHFVRFPHLTVGAPPRWRPSRRRPRAARPRGTSWVRSIQAGRSISGSLVGDDEHQRGQHRREAEALDPRAVFGGVWGPGG